MSANIKNTALFLSLLCFSFSLSSIMIKYLLNKTIVAQLKKTKGKSHR